MKSSKIKLAYYFPIRYSENHKTTIEKPGLIPGWAYRKLKDLIYNRLTNEYPEVEIVNDNLNFTRGVIYNNHLFFSHDGKIIDLNKAIDIFFWYAKIGKIPGHSHIDKLESLSNDAVVINNPYSYKITLDKLMAHRVLLENKIPVSDYFAFDIFDKSQIEIINRLIPKGKEILIKPRLGAYGLGILKISNEKELFTLQEIFSKIQHDCLLDSKKIIQKLGKNEIFEANQLYNLISYETSFHKGASIFGEIKYSFELKDWLGVTIIGKKAIYGYRKRRNMLIDGWRVSDPKMVGGHVDFSPLPGDVKEKAEKAAKALGIDIVGFDFIKSDGEWKIIDENCYPGLYIHCFKEAGTTLEDSFYRMLKHVIEEYINIKGR